MNLFKKGPKVLYRVTGNERAALEAKHLEAVAAVEAYHGLVAFIAKREQLKSCIFDEGSATFFANPAPNGQPVSPTGAPKPEGG